MKGRLVGSKTVSEESEESLEFWDLQFQSRGVIWTFRLPHNSPRGARHHIVDFDHVYSTVTVSVTQLLDNDNHIMNMLATWLVFVFVNLFNGLFINHNL